MRGQGVFWWREFGLQFPIRLNGDISPETPLVEDELAKTLNVSRTPVRESIQRLQIEGLVSSSKGRGLKVVASNQVAIKDALEIRRLLEEYAAGRAAKHATDDLIQQLLEKCKQEMEYLIQNNEENPMEASQINSGIHKLIFECANNLSLNRIIDQVLSQFEFRLYATGFSHQLREFSESHQRIALAISQHDVNAAEKEAYYHVDLLRENLFPQQMEG